MMFVRTLFSFSILFSIRMIPFSKNTLFIYFTFIICYRIFVFFRYIAITIIKRITSTSTYTLIHYNIRHTVFRIFIINTINIPRATSTLSSTFLRYFPTFHCSGWWSRYLSITTAFSRTSFITLLC